jgi:Na+-transporting methylmalonyl-CoA/oxaloacetate decarboxylase gamma subunit
MTEQNKDYLSTSTQQQLPNNTAVLVLGILSILVCFVCGIIALIMSKKDMDLYRANPDAYSTASYNNLKAGRICAIIGIALQAIGILVWLFFFAFIVSTASQEVFK